MCPDHDESRRSKWFGTEHHSGVTMACWDVAYSTPVAQLPRHEGPGNGKRASQHRTHLLTDPGAFVSNLVPTPQGRIATDSEYI